MVSRFKAVIFDMDGVIIDSEPIHYAAMQVYNHSLGFDMSHEEYASYIGTRGSDMWEELRIRHALPGTTEELLRGETAAYYRELMTNSNIAPVVGAIELIRECRSAGLRLALASSASRENIEIVEKLFSLQGLFDTTISGEELTRSKPDPAIFLISAKRLGAQPSECVVIEDAQAGVQAAKAAGMVCVGLRLHDFGRQDLSAADMVVESLTELSAEGLMEMKKGV